LVGVAGVVATKWLWLDPVVALLVAANIVWAGSQIVWRSISGLMDPALSSADLATIRQVLVTYEKDNLQFHALRTRQAGVRKFISMHVLVPGAWTVQHGHELLEQLEADIRRALPNSSVFTHLESLDDPASWDDVALDRY
jgi:divalent metal cation (Fe/Co/Zn/Cd) transporter